MAPTQPKACAACRTKHRHCSPECIFRPYFPADKPMDFANAHRLFGARKIKRILKATPADYKEDAAKVIKFHGNMRSRYPVLGPWQVYIDLQKEIERKQAELHRYQTTLAHVKSAAASSSASGSHDQQLLVPDPNNLPPPTENSNNATDFFNFPEPFDLLSEQGPHSGNSSYETQQRPLVLPDHNNLPRLTKEASDFFTAHQDFDLSSAVPQPFDSLSGEGQYGNLHHSPPASNNYQDAMKYLAPQQTFDSLSDEGHYGNSTQELLNSNSLPLPEYANNTYDDAIAFFSDIDLHYPPNNDNGQTQENADERVPYEFLNDGGGGGEHGNNDYRTRIRNHTQQHQSPFPHPNNNNGQTQLYQSRSTGNDSWKSMNDDDGNPFFN